MNEKEIMQQLDRLMRECDIRDPARKNGYLTALLDVKVLIANAIFEKEDRKE